MSQMRGRGVVVAAGGEVPFDSGARRMRPAVISVDAVFRCYAIFFAAGWWLGGEVAGEASGVDDVVVVATEQGGVREVGGAAVDPMFEVVGVGPAGGFGAAGVAASAVADV